MKKEEKKEWSNEYHKRNENLMIIKRRNYGMITKRSNDAWKLSVYRGWLIMVIDRRDESCAIGDILIFNLFRNIDWLDEEERCRSIAKDGTTYGWKIGNPLLTASYVDRLFAVKTIKPMDPFGWKMADLVTFVRDIWKKFTWKDIPNLIQ